MDEPLPATIDRHYKLATVAKLLDISRPEAYALAKTGELRTILVGKVRGIRVSESELKAFIGRAATKAAAGDARGVA